MKKHILTAVLCMALAAPVFAQQNGSCPDCTETTGSCPDCASHQGDEGCGHECGDAGCTGQGHGDACTGHGHGNACTGHGHGDACTGHGTATRGDVKYYTSEEVGVDESVVAQKMTQAEKAHNAAVNDSWGGAITIIAMCIVISALAILSILFLIFGKISKSLLSKNKKQAAVNSVHSNPDDHDFTELDSGEVIAAIAMALSEHFGEGHDMEETILTIRRLNRAYSPWNSKLYNLRQMPELHKHTPSRSAF